MRQFSQDELNEKINQFISKKRIQFPDVLNLKPIKVKEFKSPLRDGLKITVHFMPQRSAQTV